MSDPLARHDSPASADSTFDAQYRPLLREACAAVARSDLTSGSNPTEQARSYAERGKPDFALAYLLELECELADEEKRAIYAYSYERRAALTEQRARQFSRQFNRSFPLLFTEAAKDRALARQIRTGRAVGRGAGRQLPMI